MEAEAVEAEAVEVEVGWRWRWRTTLRHVELSEHPVQVRVADVAEVSRRECHRPGITVSSSTPVVEAETRPHQMEVVIGVESVTSIS